MNQPSIHRLFLCCRRSKAGSDSSEAVERGATAMKQWSSEATTVKEERGATATLHSGSRATGWRPLSTRGDAAQESGEPRQEFTICFCAVRRSEAGSDSTEGVERGALAVKQWSDGSGALKQWRGSDAAQGSKGRQGVALCQPCARNSRRQGATHELCPRPCKLEIAKPLEHDK